MSELRFDPENKDPDKVKALAHLKHKLLVLKFVIKYHPRFKCNCWGNLIFITPFCVSVFSLSLMLLSIDCPVIVTGISATL